MTVNNLNSIIDYLVLFYSNTQNIKYLCLGILIYFVLSIKLIGKRFTLRSLYVMIVCALVAAGILMGCNKRDMDLYLAQGTSFVVVAYLTILIGVLRVQIYKGTKKPIDIGDYIERIDTNYIDKENDEPIINLENNDKEN